MRRSGRQHSFGWIIWGIELGRGLQRGNLIIFAPLFFPGISLVGYFMGCCCCVYSSGIAAALRSSDGRHFFPYCQSRVPTNPVPNTRFSRDRPRFNDNLDVIKFLCKDLWTILFRKQIDNLKTNHRVRLNPRARKKILKKKAIT